MKNGQHSPLKLLGSMLSISLLTVTMVASWGSIVGLAKAQEDRHGWSIPVLISNPDRFANYPALAGAPDGSLHAIWTESPSAGEPPDAIWYSHRNGDSWSKPADILTAPNGGPVNEPMIAVDGQGFVHVTFNAPEGLWYTRAAALQADSAKAWMRPVRLADTLPSHSDIVVDDAGKLHVIYIRRDEPADVEYIDSSDNGLSWSSPVRVSESPGSGIGAVEARLAIDRRGRLHVVWWEGALDRGGWPGTAQCYARSSDGGRTWSAPITIDSIDTRFLDNYGPMFANVMTVGEDDVHIVWDGAPRGERYHLWSKDGGATWSDPRQLGPFRGITGWNAMAVDSAGTLHLVSGILGEQLIHLAWDGTRWTDPVRVDTNTRGPHWPALVVTEGNKLNAIWVELVGGGKVWFAQRRTEAPRAPTKPLPLPAFTAAPPSTAQPTPAAFQASPTPTRVVHPIPTGSRQITLVHASLPLVIGLAPAMLLIGLVLAWRLLVTARP